MSEKQDLRRPARDERWSDSNGETWQVDHVAVIQRTNASGEELAFVRFRHKSGTTVKVTAYELKAQNWKPQGRDPLGSRRTELSNAIKQGAQVLIFPDSDECPVRKGEIYHLVSGRILIDRVTRKMEKGKSERQWHVEFIRLMTERDYFIRRTPPNLGTPESASETDEQAKIESSYTANAAKSIDDLATVPPDWEDQNKGVREVKRQDAQREIQQQRQAQAAKSRLNRLLAGAKTPEQRQLLLAGIVALCEQAEAGEMKEAA